MRVKTYYKTRLPHIQPIGGTFFVTFRLGDALPQNIAKRLKLEMEDKISALIEEEPEGYKEKIILEKKRYFGKYDKQLDSMAYGNCYLKQNKVAEMVKNKLHEFDGQYYDLCAYCIMPNHVHVLLDFSVQLIQCPKTFAVQMPDSYTQLHEVMKLIKGNTSFYINKHLGRSGTLWQKDNFDHYARNEKEFGNIIFYILNNPVKARLVKRWQDWPHSYVAAKL